MLLYDTRNSFDPPSLQNIAMASGIGFQPTPSRGNDRLDFGDFVLFTSKTRCVNIDFNAKYEQITV